MIDDHDNDECHRLIKGEDVEVEAPRRIDPRFVVVSLVGLIFVVSFAGDRALDFRQISRTWSLTSETVEESSAEDEAATWRELKLYAPEWVPRETQDKVEYPHVVLSLIDDQGYADMGYSNNGFDQLWNATPFMDTLAADGIKLSQYYSQQLCTPARAALMTGYYPIHTGMQHDVIQPESLYGLPLEYKLFPSYFKEVGVYDTFMIGKWHLGHFQRAYLPYKRGFDEFYGYLSDQLWYTTHESPHACLTSGECFYDMSDNGVQAESSIGVYSTILFADVFATVLNRTVRQANKSAFVYLAWQNVHAPLDAPPGSYFTEADLSLIDSIEDPHRRTFAAITLMLDNGMRSVVASSIDHGAYPNTIFVVASDNGGCSFSGGYNWPLRAGKQYLYEGGIRVNAFVHSALIPMERRGNWYDGLFHVSDWLPTIVAGALRMNYSSPLPSDLDGVDQWQSLLGQSADQPRSEILHNIDLWQVAHGSVSNLTELDMPIQAIRVGDMKLVMGQDSSAYFRPRTASCPDGVGNCSNSSYQPTDDCSYMNASRVYLYNITSDPTESTNLATLREHEVERLAKRLAEFRVSMVSPAWKGSNYDLAYNVWSRLNNFFIGHFDDAADIAGLEILNRSSAGNLD